VNLRTAKDPTSHTGKEETPSGPSVVIQLRLLPLPSGAEEYRPTAVKAVLDNPQGQLVRSGKHGEVVETGPTARDIAGLGPPLI
jgi:hypothetical protein